MMRHVLEYLKLTAAGLVASVIAAWVDRLLWPDDDDGADLPRAVRERKRAAALRVPRRPMTYTPAQIIDDPRIARGINLLLELLYGERARNPEGAELRRLIGDVNHALDVQVTPEGTRVHDVLRNGTAALR